VTRRKFDIKAAGLHGRYSLSGFVTPEAAWIRRGLLLSCEGMCNVAVVMQMAEGARQQEAQQPPRHQVTTDENGMRTFGAPAAHVPTSLPPPRPDQSAGANRPAASIASSAASNTVPYVLLLLACKWLTVSVTPCRPK